MNLEKAIKWEPGLEIVRPINEEKIKGFRNWVTYSTFQRGLRRGIEPDPNHLGLDFISYQDERGKEHKGISKNIGLLAIADGIVVAILTPGPNNFFRRYQTYMIVKHSESGLASGYCHVTPEVNVGQKVRMGQRIASAYQIPKDCIAILPHLHFELGRYDPKKTIPEDRSPLVNHVDPEIILPNKRNLFKRTKRSLSEI